MRLRVFPLMQLAKPDMPILIHYDHDDDFFVSPFKDFEPVMESTDGSSRVIYLGRVQEYRFQVRHEKQDE